MQALVDDLLLLARSDEGSPARRRAVDLDDLVLAEATRLRSAARSCRSTPRTCRAAR